MRIPRSSTRLRLSALASLFVAVAPVAASAQPAGAPVSIDVRARLSIGVVAGDTLYELDRVTTPFLMPDGRLVVPLRGASTLRLFSPGGDFLASYGRAGEGPGEFRDLHSAWSRGDTIEAFDDDLRRIVRFLPDGSTEEIPLRTEVRDLSALAGVRGDGWVVGGVALGEFGRRDSIAVRAIRRDGSDAGQLAFAYGFARFRAPGLGGGPEPLSPRAVLDVHDGRLYIAETFTPSIRVIGPGAGPPRELRWRAGPQPDPTAAHRRAIEAAVDRAEPAQAPQVRRRLEAAPEPRQLSVFWTFLVDAAGYVWIQPYDPMRHAFTPFPQPAAGGRWTILSPSGEVVGQVEVPADLEPRQITRDAVVGIARDGLGVESVRVHALRRR